MRNFDCATESKGNYLYQPYDFLLMSGKVPRDWPLLFIDSIAHRYSLAETFTRISEYSPEIIVCSLASTNWQQDVEFVKTTRSKFPDAFLFVFGDLFIEENPVAVISPFVDGIFTSPVMFDFVNLEADNFESARYEGFRSEGFYQRSDLKAAVNFTLGDIRHQDFISKQYRWPFSKHFFYTTIFTAWGCPYSCSYCIMSKFPNYWRDYREILNEMEDISRLGVKEVYIGDRSFGLPLQNVMKLLDGMIEKKFNFSWSTYFHPNQYTPQLLEKMHKSGCHTIIVGIETFDQADLKVYGRHVRKDQFDSLLVHAKELGIEICGDFIIGLPHDDMKSVEKTLEFSKAAGIDFASFNVAAPLPGSSIRKLAIEAGTMARDEEHFDSLGNNKVLSVSSLTSKEIVELKNRAVMGFYLRPDYLIRRLLKIKNYEHLVIQLEEAFQLLMKALPQKKI